MPTSYPGAVDNFTNPTPGDDLNSGTVPHDTQHANANDAIEAIEVHLNTTKATADSVAANQNLVVQEFKTASYVLVLADAGKVIDLNLAAAGTLTIPADATANFPVGTVIGWRQSGAGQITLTAAAGVTLLSSGSRFKSSAQFAEGGITKRSANQWIASGDLVA